MVIISLFKDRSTIIRQQIVLDTQPWTINSTYNAREDAWYIDISDRNNNLVLASIRLVPNLPLLIQQKYMDLPNGDFVDIDLQDDSINSGITKENQDVRYFLIFYTNEELGV